MAGRHKYLINGSGRQAEAIALYLARQPNTRLVAIQDEHAPITHVHALVERLQSDKVTAVRWETQRISLVLLEAFDVLIHAGDFTEAVVQATAARTAGLHYCDLGGNDAVTSEILCMGSSKSVIPDCGLAPGTVNVMANLAKYMSPCDCHGNLILLCGGMPVDHDQPYGYARSFSPVGLANEYTGDCQILDSGNCTTQSALEFIDPSVEIAGCKYQAAPTSGGASLGPKRWRGRVHSYAYYTLRPRGSQHFEVMQALKKFGLFEPHNVKGFDSLAQQVWAPVSDTQPDYTLAAVRWDCSCGANKREYRFRVGYDHELGLSAMQQATGYSAGIVAEMQAEGKAPNWSLTPAEFPSTFTTLYMERLAKVEAPDWVLELEDN